MQTKTTSGNASARAEHRASYQATFTGRVKGAIGSFQKLVAVTSGETPEAAILALYERYDHISNPQLRQFCPNCGQFLHDGRNGYLDCVNDCAGRNLAPRHANSR
jgi:ribosomal protein S27AE